MVIKGACVEYIQLATPLEYTIIITLEVGFLNQIKSIDESLQLFNSFISVLFHDLKSLSNYNYH